MKVCALQEEQVFDANRFTKRDVFREGAGEVFVLNLLPGQSLPPHKHPGSELFILVLRGEGDFTVDEGGFVLGEQQVVHCEGDETLSIRNTGDTPLSLFVVLSPTLAVDQTQNGEKEAPNQAQ